MLARNQAIYTCSWSRDGKRVLTCSEDKSIKLWEIGSGACTQTLVGHGGEAYAGSFSPSGSIIGSRGEDAVLRVWDADSGACRAALAGQKPLSW